MDLCERRPGFKTNGRSLVFCAVTPGHHAERRPRGLYHCDSLSTPCSPDSARITYLETKLHMRMNLDLFTSVSHVPGTVPDT